MSNWQSGDWAIVQVGDVRSSEVQIVGPGPLVLIPKTHLRETTEAAKLLRAAGWIVHPPQAEEIPEPQVGQVWVSSNLRVEPRTVVEIGPHRYGPENWVYVYFTSKSKPIHPKWGASKLDIDAWRKWARTSGARPVEKMEGKP